MPFQKKTEFVSEDSPAKKKMMMRTTDRKHYLPYHHIFNHFCDSDQNKVTEAFTPLEGQQPTARKPRQVLVAWMPSLEGMPERMESTQTDE